MHFEYFDDEGDSEQRGADWSGLHHPSEKNGFVLVPTTRESFTLDGGTFVGAEQEHTPTEKLQRNFEMLLDRKRGVAGKLRVGVLLSTGSYNPVHDMHLGMLEVARKHLSGEDCSEEECQRGGVTVSGSMERDYAIIASYLSPSHDLWLKHKFKGKEGLAMLSKDRIRAVQLLCRHHPYASCSSWECLQQKFVSFPQVIQHIKEVAWEGIQTVLLRRRAASKGKQDPHVDVDLRVVYVCGMDHAVKCKLETQSLYHVACIERVLPSGPVPVHGQQEGEEKDGVEGPCNCRWVSPNMLFIAGGEERPKRMVSSSIIRHELSQSLCPNISSTGRGLGSPVCSLPLGLPPIVHHYLSSHCTYLSWITPPPSYPSMHTALGRPNESLR
eukprot:Nk52_evm41s210 gene=Nk52_evmTU41s210